MLDPPDIIKTLRAEEQQGLLFYTTQTPQKQITQEEPPSEYPISNSMMFTTHEKHDGTVCVGIEKNQWNNTTGTLLDTVLNALSDIFYVIDEHGNFLKWNRSLEKITGYNHKKSNQ